MCVYQKRDVADSAYGSLYKLYNCLHICVCISKLLACFMTMSVVDIFFVIFPNFHLEAIQIYQRITVWKKHTQCVRSHSYVTHLQYQWQLVWAHIMSIYRVFASIYTGSSIARYVGLRWDLVQLYLQWYNALMVDYIGSQPGIGQQWPVQPV